MNAGHRILIVDDDGDSSQLLSHLLRPHGYMVATANSVREAERLCRRGGGFDVIVCDIQLPDGSGLDLLNHARRWRDAEGIIVSDHDDAGLMRRAAQAGYAHYFVKPLDLNQFVETLAALSMHASRSP